MNIVNGENEWQNEKERGVVKVLLTHSPKKIGGGRRTSMVIFTEKITKA